MNRGTFILGYSGLIAAVVCTIALRESFAPPPAKHATSSVSVVVTKPEAETTVPVRVVGVPVVAAPAVTVPAVAVTIPRVTVLAPVAPVASPAPIKLTVSIPPAPPAPPVPPPVPIVSEPPPPPVAPVAPIAPKSEVPLVTLGRLSPLTTTVRVNVRPVENVEPKVTIVTPVETTITPRVILVEGQAQIRGKINNEPDGTVIHFNVQAKDPTKDTVTTDKDRTVSLYSVAVNGKDRSAGSFLPGTLVAAPEALTTDSFAVSLDKPGKRSMTYVIKGDVVRSGEGEVTGFFEDEAKCHWKLTGPGEVRIYKANEIIGLGQSSPKADTEIGATIPQLEWTVNGKSTQFTGNGQFDVTLADGTKVTAVVVPWKDRLVTWSVPKSLPTSQN